MTEGPSAVEEALAHQARAIEDLSDVVREQWAEIARLRRELQRLEATIERMGEEPGNDPLPPHY